MICEVTATVHSAVFASMSWSSSTMSGTSDDAAGLKAIDPTETPNATAYARATLLCTMASMPMRTARSTSAATTTDRRG